MWHLEYDVQISRVSTTDYISPCMDWISGCSRQNLTLCYSSFHSWIIQITAIFLACRWFSLLGNVDNLSFTWYGIQAISIAFFVLGNTLLRQFVSLLGSVVNVTWCAFGSGIQNWGNWAHSLLPCSQNWRWG